MKQFVEFDIDVLKYSVMDECILTDIEYDRPMTEILQDIGVYQVEEVNSKSVV